MALNRQLLCRMYESGFLFSFFLSFLCFILHVPHNNLSICSTLSNSHVLMLNDDVGFPKETPFYTTLPCHFHTNMHSLIGVLLGNV